MKNSLLPTPNLMCLQSNCQMAEGEAFKERKNRIYSRRSSHGDFKR